MKRRVAILALFALAAGVTPVHAAPPPGRAAWADEDITIEPGSTAVAGIVLTLDEGWHTYWVNSGDSGAAANLDWTLPEGIEIVSVQWPAPERFVTGALVSYGFEGRVTALITLRADEDLAVDKTWPVRVDLFWLVCEEVCIPVTSGLSTSIRIVERVNEAGEPDWLTDAKAELPESGDDWFCHLLYSDETLELHGEVEGADVGAVEEAFFYPRAGGLIDNVAKQRWEQEGEVFRLTMQRAPGVDNMPGRIEGILHIDGSQGARSIAISAKTSPKKLRD
jgi:thiol:disulfide interchange protein DsbD